MRNISHLSGTLVGSGFSLGPATFREDSSLSNSDEYERMVVLFQKGALKSGKNFMNKKINLLQLARAEPERAFLANGSRWLKTKYLGELAVR